jgi:hypothetical protein
MDGFWQDSRYGSSIEQILSSSIAEPRFRTLLPGVFAALALVFAGVCPVCC